MTNVRPLFPAGHPRHIPEAWPALLSEDQLRAYVGGISKETLVKICPVPPVDLGANLLRYQRDAVDRWVAGLALKTSGLRKEPPGPKNDDTPAPGDDEDGQDRIAAALDRVRARSRRSAPCRKTG